MHNTIAHHLQTSAHPVPEQRSSPSSQLLPADVQGMMFSDMGYPFGQFSSTVLLMLSPSFLCHSSLAEYEKLKSPLLRVGTTEQQTKHQGAIYMILLLNQNHSTSPAIRKRINSIPAKMRTMWHLWTRLSIAHAFLCVSLPHTEPASNSFFSIGPSFDKSTFTSGMAGTITQVTSYFCGAGTLDVVM